MDNKLDSSNISKEKALEDLNFVSDIIKQFEESRLEKNVPALKAQLWIDLFLLLSCGTLLFVEWATMGMITRDFYYSVQDSEFRKSGLINLGIITALGLGFIYLLTWINWKKTSLSFSKFLEKNFNYLKKLNIGVDFCTKFIALSLVIAAGKIEYVAPLLLIFQFDILLQGKIFNFTFKQGSIFGLSALAIALWMLSDNQASMMFPLAFFFAIALYSALKTVHSIRQKK